MAAGQGGNSSVARWLLGRVVAVNGAAVSNRNEIVAQLAILPQFCDVAFTFEVDGSPAEDGSATADGGDDDATPPPPMPPRKPPRPTKAAAPAPVPAEPVAQPAPAPAAPSQQAAPPRAPVAVSPAVVAGAVTKAEESAVRALEARFSGIANADRFAVPGRRLIRQDKLLKYDTKGGSKE